MMQTDVKAGYVSTTSTVFSARTRLKGLFITPGTATGSVVVRDGGASGTVLISTATAQDGTPFSVIIPGEGVLCATNIHVTLAGTGTTAVVFYG
jgi:hypothetical protein